MTTAAKKPKKNISAWVLCNGMGDYVGNEGELPFLYATRAAALDAQWPRTTPLRVKIRVFFPKES